MVISANAYCNEVCDDETYRENVLARLDQIVEALGVDDDDESPGTSPSLEAVTWIPITYVDSADLTASFLEFLADENNKKYIQIVNDTDAAIEVSFDGTDVHGYISVNGSWTHNFGSNLGFEQNSVFLRYVDDPSDGGFVRIMAYY